MTERTYLSRLDGVRLPSSGNVPNDGITTINASLGWVINTLTELPFPRGVAGGNSVMRSFQNNDYEKQKRYTGSELVGLYGLADSLHLITRQHVGHVHTRYKATVLTALEKQPWNERPVKELEKLQTCLSNAQAVLHGSVPKGGEKFQRALNEMKQTVDAALGEAPNRAQKAAMYWGIGEVSAAFTRMASHPEADATLIDGLKPVMDSIDQETQAVLDKGPGLIQGDSTVDFPLLDNKGETIILSDGKPAIATLKDEDSPTAVDYVVGAVGAKGVLNDKFAQAYQLYGGKLMGNASATLSNLGAVASDLVTSLQENHPNVPKEEIEGALSAAGINFTASAWMAIKSSVEASHAQASLEQHIHHLGRVDSRLGISTNYRGLLAAVGTDAHDEKTLTPSTRYHYLGILNGVEGHRLSVSNILPNKKCKALENAIADAKQSLLPQKDELEHMPNGLPYFHKDSPVQTVPDEEMRGVLENVLEKVQAFQTARKRPVEGMQALSDLMRAGLAEGVAIGGAGEGRTR